MNQDEEYMFSKDCPIIRQACEEIVDCLNGLSGHQGMTAFFTIAVTVIETCAEANHISKEQAFDAVMFAIRDGLHIGEEAKS